MRLNIRSLWEEDQDEAEAEFRYAFDQDRIVLGRSAGSDVCIPHKAVSQRHAVIAADQAHYTVTDLDSTNGTRVNGERLAPHRPKRLGSNDRLECGGFEVVFTAGVPIAAPTSEIGTASFARQMVATALAQTGEPGALPELRVAAGPDEGKIVTLPGPPGRFTVGRAEDSDLLVTDTDVSRHHMEVYATVDGYEVCDLNSKNGILFSGRPIKTRRLRHGDVIQLGRTVLLFEDPVDTVVRNLQEAPDEKLDVPTRTLSAASGEDVAEHDSQPEPERGAPAMPQTGRKRVPATTGYGLDLMIYVLAGAVLALSIAGLVALLQP